ncbi:DUF2530 domain-containing protein [Phycicoccus sp.]|uniref:DUF2530 domain-containing protein n=1 Tax=Phycicoccus sp. TaxID=1902410 RepID=UPI002BB66D3A|nr:DUF2530 domain-containing protein [Phycicoccus sp.]HMM94925.1 DUF2530 domain-containing protein [Phycicoccus sp.]
MTEQTPDGARDPLGRSAPVDPPNVPTAAIILVGCVGWAVALVATLVVPALHSGDRSWWPWACVTGLALGAFAAWYVRRGRGSAASA